MSVSGRQGLVFVLSLILLVQVAVPWHMLHMQAVAGQAPSAEHGALAEHHIGPAMAHDHAVTNCHTPGNADGDAAHIAGFCEWLCAQAQTTPLLDDLVVTTVGPSNDLPAARFGADQLPDAVPTPPPIA